MDNIQIEKYNETFNKILCEPGIAKELSDFFTFDVPNAKFSPIYKNKIWDGKIRLYNIFNHLLYAGLNPYVEEFCKQCYYNLEYLDDFSDDEFSVKEARDFINSINCPLKARDYQLESFIHAIRHRRALFLSPTSSGKTFIIYLIVRYYLKKTLIIVPTTSLVYQIASDFKDYGLPEEYVAKITAGVDKNICSPVIVTTWQSVYKLDKKWFDQFDVIIGDEAHLFKAKSLVSIMQKATKSKYRFGFTGTLDGTQTHRLVLEGLFGSVRKVTTTAELIEQRHLADFNIKAILLSYPKETRKEVLKYDYPDEIEYLINLNKRNTFIRNLALSLEGNTLILYQFVEKHGQILYDMLLRECSSDHSIYFVHGQIEGQERDLIRAKIEQEDHSIIVASYGTFSTGINITKLDNIIFASPSKSRIRNLQSIGRVLRRSESKTKSTLYDIADDFSIKSKKNFTLLHFIERIKIYNSEKFPYKIYRVSINN